MRTGLTGGRLDKQVREVNRKGEKKKEDGQTAKTDEETNRQHVTV